MQNDFTRHSKVVKGACNRQSRIHMAVRCEPVRFAWSLVGVQPVEYGGTLLHAYNSWTQCNVRKSESTRRAQRCSAQADNSVITRLNYSI
eukprot:6192309-Pleurochrysis_carterae.AAC.1